MWLNVCLAIAQVTIGIMTSDRPERDRIDITYAKRQMVYAKYTGEYKETYCDWLILVDRVDVGICDADTLVWRHASYSIADKNNVFHFSETPQNWGNTQNYQFYKVTDAERKFFISKITENGFKYVRVLNKLVPR